MSLRLRPGLPTWAPVAVAALVFTWRLGYSSLWADEGETFGVATHGVQAYEHPMGYFWFMGVWLKAFGPSEFSMRLPSALACVGLVAVTMAMAKSFWPRALPWAGWVVALSPFVRLGAQEARMYAPMALTQALALWGLLMVLRDRPRGAWVWAVGTSLSVSMAHLAWLACWPAWLLTLLMSRHRRILLVAAGLAILSYAPFAPATWHQVSLRLQGGHLGSTPSLLAGLKKLVGFVFYQGAGYHFVALDGARLKAVFGSPRVLLFCLQLVVPAVVAARGWSRLTASWPRGTAIAATFFVPPFLFLVYEGSPANLLLPMFAVWALATGAGLSGWRWWPLLILAWAPSWVSHATSRGYLLHPEDWRSMSAHVRTHATPRDALFLTGSRNSLFMAEYYPFAPAQVHSAVGQDRASAPFDPHKPDPDASLVAPVQRLLGRHPSVWLVVVDWNMPRVERAVDTLWARWGTWRERFGEGLELILLGGRP